MRAVRLPRLHCALLGLLPLAARAGALARAPQMTTAVVGGWPCGGEQAVERAAVKKALAAPLAEGETGNL